MNGIGVAGPIAPGNHDPAVTEPLPVPVSDDFADLFQSQYPRVVRALVLSGADRWQAEDIAQESFARLFGHWRRVRTGASPAGYVFVTAFRMLRRRGLLPTSPLDEGIGDRSTTEDAATVHVDLQRALAAMPPRRRACVVLCWLAETPTAEAAEVLGVAPGTVRKQLELARRDLAADLRD